LHVFAFHFGAPWLPGNSIFGTVIAAAIITPHAVEKPLNLLLTSAFDRRWQHQSLSITHLKWGDRNDFAGRRVTTIEACGDQRIENSLRTDAKRGRTRAPISPDLRSRNVDVFSNKP
jgi:hypothetical protein